MPDSNDNSSKDNSAVKQEAVSRTPLNLAITKNTKILALFAIACTAAVGLVSELTKDKIKVQEQQYLLQTLHSIIEPSRYDNDIANDCIHIKTNELGSNTEQTAYIARKADEVVAIALTSTATEGYSGNIDFIIAINTDGSVSGVRVLNHKETPGLGDKIEIKKSDWITSFNGKYLRSENDSRWAVVKDQGMFDQFTAATITPRAVVKGIKNTLNYFAKNKDLLLNRSNACGDASIMTTITDNEAANE